MNRGYCIQSGATKYICLTSYVNAYVYNHCNINSSPVQIDRSKFKRKKQQTNDKRDVCCLGLIEELISASCLQLQIKFIQPVPNHSKSLAYSKILHHLDPIVAVELTLTTFYGFLKTTQ